MKDQILVYPESKLFLVTVFKGSKLNMVLQFKQFV